MADLPSVPPLLSVNPKAQLPEELLSATESLPSVVPTSSTITAEKVGDFDEALRRQHRAISSLIATPKSAATVYDRLASPQAAVSASGVVTYPSATLLQFQSQVAPRRQVSLSSKGYALARKETNLLTKGLVSGSVTKSLVCKGAFGLLNQALTLSSKGDVASGLVEVLSYRWTTDTAVPWATGIPDVPLSSLVSGVRYLLAVRVRFSGAPATTATSLECQAITTLGDYSGTWGAPAGGSAFDWTTLVLYTAKTDGSVINTAEFVTNSGGGVRVAGAFNSDSTPNGAVLLSGQESELWFAVKPTASAVGKRVVFRLVSTSVGHYAGSVFDTGLTAWTPVISS